MQLRTLIRDDDAVSPVISVILMVAITVILAAVISVLVLGLGESTSDTAPQADFSFEYNDTSGDVTVKHASGDTLNGDQLRFAGAALEKTSYGSISEWSGGDVEAGDTATVNVEAGGTLRVVWESKDATDSATLGTYNVPEEAGASGQVSITSVQSVLDETSVSIGSLSQTGGSANLVLETGSGDKKTKSVNSGDTPTLTLSIDPGETVTATLYETGENNKLSSDNGSPATEASIGNVDAVGGNKKDTRSDGHVLVENLRFNGTSGDSVYVEVTNADSGTGETSDSATVSASEYGDNINITGLEEGNIGADEDVTVKVWESQSTAGSGTPLAEQTVDADPDGQLSSSY